MSHPQETYDEAMHRFSTGDYEGASVRLRQLLAEDPAHFEAQLALGMIYFRLGDYQAAIEAGHKAERLNPKDQLVHTNLSLFYMKAGDKKTAEHHALQSRIASWKTDLRTATPDAPADNDLKMAPEPGKTIPPKFPEMPWKKKVP